MKASSASFSYGHADYPVAETNLPNVPIEDAISEVLRQMSRLSGGFALKAPNYIRLDIVGDGYIVRLTGGSDDD